MVQFTAHGKSKNFLIRKHPILAQPHNESCGAKSCDEIYVNISLFGKKLSSEIAKYFPNPDSQNFEIAIKWNPSKSAVRKITGITLINLVWVILAVLILP